MRTRSLVAGALLLGTLAACGGGGDDGGTTDRTSVVNTANRDAVVGYLLANGGAGDSTAQTTCMAEQLVASGVGIGDGGEVSGISDSAIDAARDAC